MNGTIKTHVKCVEARNAPSRCLKILLFTLLLAGIAAPGQSTNALTSTISATVEIGQPPTREFQIARRQVRRRPGDDTSPSRGVTDPTLPYLISPRNTAILESQPLLRWHPIPGVTRYRVEVGANGQTWTEEVGETQVVYAGEPLKPGFRYWVTVTADNGTSTKGKDDVGFTVLGEDEAQEATAEIARLEGQLLTEETAFEWVEVYTQHGLYADAIEVLERQVRSGNRTLDVCGALGDLYRWVGLDALAVERYEMALEQAARNRWEQAGLQVDLGDVNYVSGKLEEAVRWYEEALASYQALGETERVRELQGKIDDLKRRLP
jgi:hypothetical protein